MPSRGVLVSPSLAISVAITLALSFVVNVVCLFAYRPNLASTSMPTQLWEGSQSEPTALPIAVRPALLTTENSPRLGLGADDDDWARLLPYGQGFVHHPGTDTFHLISQYHQIHCLRSFRNYFKFLMDGNSTLGTPSVSHIDHCMRYMRQMVLCYGDTTLEPTHKQRAQDGSVVDAVTGVGVTHTCRDWTQIWEYAETSWRAWEVQNASMSSPP